MALNIFLFFPETDDQILNDISKKSVLDFFKISKLIKNESDINFFYDEKNIDSFLKQNKISEIYLDNIINQLRLKLYKKGAINIQTKNIIDKKCFYFQWNFNHCKVENCFEILKEITERKVQFYSEQFILINFNNSIQHCRERILVFKDAKHINEFPANFIHVDFVSDFLEFEIWYKTKNIKNFSLLNKNKFTRTSIVQQGKPVFRSVENDYFWYLDNFHKDEYEVFDTNKNHIGVSDLEGNLDMGKAIKGRTFD